jgi:hypothetical protein
MRELPKTLAGPKYQGQWAKDLNQLSDGVRYIVRNVLLAFSKDLHQRMVSEDGKRPGIEATLETVLAMIVQGELRCVSAEEDDTHWHFGMYHYDTVKEQYNRRWAIIVHRVYDTKT